MFTEGNRPGNATYLPWQVRESAGARASVRKELPGRCIAARGVDSRLAAAALTKWDVDQVPPPPLLLDLYELTMAQSYFAEEMHAPATFSLFVRHLPPRWGFFLAAGLEDVLAYLEALRFRQEDLAYLESTGLFTALFLEWLGRLRFRGAVRALAEGTAYFPQEPLLEVTASMVEAQIVETMIVNQVHLQTILASKAARCMLAARGRRLVDFSLRRAHGVDAGLMVARCSYLAGFDATSNVEAGRRYGIPIAGTMAHSYIQAFRDESAAFRAFARAYPDASILLVDTYDTAEGTRRAAVVGSELAGAGHTLRGVRLDSGDLAALSFDARAILDAASLPEVTIFASGSLDEHVIAEAVACSAPIDGFGVGSRLGVCADAPYLDMAYKLVAYDDRPVLKLSAGKATWPGAKQVWRRLTEGGGWEDTLALAEESPPPGAKPLLREVMRNGRRLEWGSLSAARERARRTLEALPATLRHLEQPSPPEARPSARLLALRDGVAHSAALESAARR